MRETQMLARHFRRVAIPRAPMAVRASVGVMRILVAFDAIGRRREVHRPGLSGLLDARMALVAVDAFEHVCTMLERPILFVPFEAKHLGACSGGAGEQD
jgi:hypothetical protein